MKVCVLASGSKGNATYIEDDNHKILIDVGITYKDMEDRLSQIKVKPEDIDTVLVTHAHSDHVKGLGTFYSKVKPNIYMTSKTYGEINDKVRSQIKAYSELPNNFMIGSIKVKTINLSHDVECHGYIIEDGTRSLVYVTDTGYINTKYYEILQGKNIYIFESNHDPVMNMNSKKPKQLRDRVISDSGHLSNEQASYCLSRIVNKDTMYILLAHLSEDDNKEDIALNTLKNELLKQHKTVKYVKAARQKIISDLIEV